MLLIGGFLVACVPTPTRPSLTFPEDTSPTPTPTSSETDPSSGDEFPSTPPPPGAGAVSVHSGGALLAGSDAPWARYEGRWIHDDVGMTVGGADLDGDGDTELVVGARAWWTQDDETHGFVLHPVPGVTHLGDGEGPAGCFNGLPLGGDLDGDAVPDALCLGAWDEPADAVLSGTTLSTARLDTSVLRIEPASVVMLGGDLDQDGVDELLMSGYVLPDDPWVGALTAADARLTFDGVLRGIVDLDGDGGPELLVDGDGFSAWIYPSDVLRGAGHVGTEVAVPTVDTNATDIGDIDGDGWVDVKVRGTGDLVDLLSGADLLKGARTVLASIDLGPGGSCANLAAAGRDVDGDGRPELAVLSCGAEVWVFRGEHLPTDGGVLHVEDAWVQIPMAYPRVGALVWVDDVDGDTLPDLVVGDSRDRTDAPERWGVEEPCGLEQNAGDPTAAPVLVFEEGWGQLTDAISLMFETTDPDGDLAGVGVLRVFAGGVLLFEQPLVDIGETFLEIPYDTWGIPRGASTHIGFLVRDAAGNTSECADLVADPE